MHFGEKLRLLTHVYKLSNSKLAKAINVDASLISRWKTGDRTISTQSPHLAALATFFIQTDAYPYQKAYLSRLLQSLAAGQTDQDLTEVERIHVLANWLAVPDDVDMPQFPVLPVAPADPVKLLDNISNWFNESAEQGKKDNPDVPERMGSSAAGNWQDQAVPGLMRSCEFYQGLNGKRQAVINLLLEVLESPKPCELLMLSEEHMNWLTDDLAFIRCWAQLLRQVIEKGHKITVIHIVSRRTQEISSILEYWLPLHLSGQLRSYYNPRYIDPVIQQTLFIVRDRIVCLAQSTDDLKQQGLTQICRDRDAVRYYVRLYESVLAQCLPLLEAYTPHKLPEFQDDLKALQEQPGRQYTIRRQLNPFLMPLQIFARLLHSDAPAKTPQSAEWLLASRERFLQKAEDGYEICDMVPLSLLDDIGQNSACIAATCELFVRQPIRLDATEAAAWLEQVAMTLRTHKSYHLYLFHEEADIDRSTFSMAYYEHQAALFSPVGREHPFVILLREANSLHSLGFFLERYIARIPSSQKNREDVLRRLDATIARLRQNIGTTRNRDRFGS